MNIYPVDSLYKLFKDCFESLVIHRYEQFYRVINNIKY